MRVGGRRGAEYPDDPSILSGHRLPVLTPHISRLTPQASSLTRRLLCIVFTALSSPLLAQNQVREDRPRAYRIFASDHFDVYYDADDLRPRAAETAGRLENVRARLAQDLGRVPLRRVPVFLYRSHDDFEQTTVGGGFIPESVGAFTEVTQDRMVVPLFPSQRFLQRVLEHEYVHVLQFDHFFTMRFPSYWLLAFPFYPDWFMEGGASYHAHFWDTRDDMRIRDLVLEDRLRPLRELSGFSHLNPGEVGEAYYLGALAHRFLAETVGPDAPRRLFDAFAERFPFPQTYVVRRAVGMDLDAMDRKFRDWVRGVALRAAEGKRDAADFAEPLTRPFGYYRTDDWSPAVSPDGRSVAFLSDRWDLASLYVMDADGSGRREILPFKLTYSIESVSENGPATSWDPKSDRLAVIGEWLNRHAIYLVRPTFPYSADRIDLPFDDAFSPAFSPDGTRIAFSGQRLGLTDLYVVEPATGRIDRLTDDPDHDDAPRWSPDGRSIVYVSERDGQTDLVLYDLASRKSRPLTRTWSDESAPAWSPDGKWIAFASDSGGIPNLYAMEAATGKTWRLTDVKGGCFSPSWTPDGKSLVFAYYRHGRHTLYRMPFDVSAATPLALPADDERKTLHRYEELQRQPIEPTAERPYSTEFSWDLALPLIGFNLFALSDRTGEHAIELTVSPSATHERLYVESDLTYLYTGLRPDIGVDLFHRITEVDNPDRDRIDTGGLAFISFPFSQYLSGTLAYAAFDEIEDPETGPVDRDFDTGPLATLAWSNVRTRGIHPTGGFAAVAGLRSFDDSLGSDEDTTEYFGRAEAFYTLYPDHVIALAGAFDKATGQDRDDFDLSEGPGGGLGVRGYGSGEVQGFTRVLFKAEYRFPIWRDLNLVFPYQMLLLKDVRAFVFGDLGMAVNRDVGRRLRDFGDEAWRHSLGAGIRFDFYLLERLPLPLAIQVAKVTDHDAGWDLLVTVGFDLFGTSGGSPARPASPSKLLR